MLICIKVIVLGAEIFGKFDRDFIPLFEGFLKGFSRQSPTISNVVD